MGAVQWLEGYEKRDRTTNGEDLAAEIIRNMLAEMERVSGENSAVMREASSLAVWLHKTSYSFTAPGWQPCNTPAGVITQIDNMVTGIPDVVRRQSARESVEIVLNSPALSLLCKYEAAHRIKNHFGLEKTP